MKAKVVYRPMTADEIAMGLAVLPGRVSYLAGSAEKRFAWSMFGAANSDKQITEKQAAWLRRLVWRFRRQLPTAICALVPEKPVGDLSEASFASVPEYRNEYRNVNEHSREPIDSPQGLLL